MTVYQKAEPASKQAGSLNMLWGDGNWCVRNVRDVSHPSVFIRRCQYWQRRMNTLGKGRDCHTADVTDSENIPENSARHCLLPIKCEEEPKLHCPKQWPSYGFSDTLY